MIIITGTLNGYGGYTLNGDFTITKTISNELLFETMPDFYFGMNGRGTPAPGFALFKGDPTGLPVSVIDPIAKETDFLRIANEEIDVEGKQSALLEPYIDIDRYDTLILWCFRFSALLGTGKMMRS